MTRTAGWLAPVVVLGVVLTGCGGSSPAARPGTSPSPSASSSAVIGPSAPAFASTSAGSPRDVISKPDFLIDANAMCSAVDAQLQALPAPTDDAAMRVYVTGVLRIMPVYLSHAQTLVARTAERAQLEKNWLIPERADYDAFKPAGQALLQALDAHDDAAVQAAVSDLSAVPDHSDVVQAYLNGYGLPSCAHIDKS
ncbi:hypothetical protein [Jatrophihabitans sp.]|uniref:hypothetical protein n=1 Tax=Jatrophihabitans sp. TaxID=1932789 RepID=UPI002BD575AD|nr:hypothetical protein [Jatrophihabitans sp.]